jgi:hypothetical protein
VLDDKLATVMMTEIPPKDPWMRTSPGTRRAMLLEFMKTAAPLQTGLAQCSPHCFKITNEYAAILATALGEPVPEDARAVAEEWFLRELAAKHSAKAEYDAIRKSVAIHALKGLTEKKGVAWTLNLFRPEKRAELIDRIRSAAEGSRPEVAAWGKQLLEQFAENPVEPAP